MKSETIAQKQMSEIGRLIPLSFIDSCLFRASILENFDLKNKRCLLALA